jgi:8-oxo-dGTP diphosphatase
MKVTCESDDVKISREHDDFGWFSWDEVEDMISKGLLTTPAVNAFNRG